MVSQVGKKQRVEKEYALEKSTNLNVGPDKMSVPPMTLLFLQIKEIALASRVSKNWRSIVKTQLPQLLMRPCKRIQDETLWALKSKRGTDESINENINEVIQLVGGLFDFTIKGFSLENFNEARDVDTFIDRQADEMALLNPVTSVSLDLNAKLMESLILHNLNGIVYSEGREVNTGADFSKFNFSPKAFELICELLRTVRQENVVVDEYIYVRIDIFMDQMKIAGKPLTPVQLKQFFDSIEFCYRDRNIRALFLTGNGINHLDDVLAVCKRKKVKGLNLEDNPLEGDCMDKLGNFIASKDSCLKYFSVEGCGLGDTGFDRLQQAIEQIEKEYRLGEDGWEKRPKPTLKKIYLPKAITARQKKVTEWLLSRPWLEARLPKE